MNQKSNKGITLIALVITIIVLLILAGVTLNIVLGDDGIIARAQQANEAQKNAEKADQEALDLAAAQVDQYTEGTPAYYAAKGELKVGDYITYDYTAGTYETTLVDDDGVSQSFNSGTDDAIANDKWRVLSTDNGMIQIMPDITVVPKLTMYGAKAYLNAETVLNEMCEALYSGEYGTARSIEVEDIDKKVGYNGTRWYNLYADRGWGNIWRYENVMDKVKEGFTGEIITLGQLMNNSTYELKAIPDKYRTEPDGGKITDDLEIDYYSYGTWPPLYDTPEYNNPYANLVIKNYLYVEGKENIEFEMLAAQTLKTDNATALGFTSAHTPYWMANSVRDVNLSVDNAENSYVKYGVRTMNNGSVLRSHVWNAKEGAQDAPGRSYGVVPVVTLKSGLQVEKNEITNAWEIK